MAIFFTVHDSNKIGKLHNKYNDVTINDEFIGEIIDLYTTKGASFVVLGDSKKIFLTNSRNYKYSGKNRYLSHILSKGDTIVKKKRNKYLNSKKTKQRILLCFR